MCRCGRIVAVDVLKRPGDKLDSKIWNHAPVHQSASMTFTIEKLMKKEVLASLIFLGSRVYSPGIASKCAYPTCALRPMHFALWSTRESWWKLYCVIRKMQHLAESTGINLRDLSSLV